MVNPDDNGPMPWIRRACWYAFRGENEKAIADCTKAIELDPHNAELYVVQGNLHFAQVHANQAWADFDKAQALAPDDPTVWSVRGELHQKLDQWDEALADANRYVELKPDDAGAALLLAQTLLLAGRTEEYRQACTEVLGRFAQSDNPEALGSAARACVLAPQAVPDPMRPVGLAERAVSGAPRGGRSILSGWRTCVRDSSTKRVDVFTNLWSRTRSGMGFS